MTAFQIKFRVQTWQALCHRPSSKNIFAIRRTCVNAFANGAVITDATQRQGAGLLSAMITKFNGLRLSPARDEPGMPRFLPQTMIGLVAAGCLLAAAPLLAALVMAGVALQDLSQRAENLVEEGLAVTSLGAELQDQVYNLERNARQYVALGDPELLPVVEERMRETHTTLTQISAHSALRAPFVEHVATMRQGLTDAGKLWGDGSDPVNLEAALDKMHALGPEADAIVAAGRQSMNAQVVDLRNAAAGARHVIFLSGVALLPLAALLVMSLSFAVTRPLHRLSRGIAALGHAQYAEPIAIGYPREMQRLGEQLDWLRRRLAQLEADKDRFLRHVSHELKTPLATLHEGAELFREGSLGPLTEQQMEVAEIMAEASNELSTLIANLLAYAEWRGERRQQDAVWFELQPLVEEVLASHTLSFARHEVSAELDLQTPRLFGNRSQLRAALANLIANAIRYAPAGTPVIVRAGIDDGACELSVQDSGRGVPEHEKQRIFEPFVRGERDEATNVRGTGIGLSIVKEAALAHGGSVEVDDARPGARFRMRWPVPQSLPKSAARGMPARARA
jgi:two-component system sensor histidine kinase GlrK